QPAAGDEIIACPGRSQGQGREQAKDDHVSRRGRDRTRRLGGRLGSDSVSLYRFRQPLDQNPAFLARGATERRYPESAVSRSAAWPNRYLRSRDLDDGGRRTNLGQAVATLHPVPKAFLTSWELFHSYRLWPLPK